VVFRETSADSKLEVGYSRMLAGWQSIRSFFAGGPRMGMPRPAGEQTEPASPAEVAIVALVAGDEERNVLANVSSREQWDLRFVESCEGAHAVSKELTAPVILCDRDWPFAEWRSMVQNLASQPHRPCVILASTVSDDYLWKELIRHGGYDVLAKPLRAEDVARVVKLALSYWKSVARVAFIRR